MCKTGEVTAQYEYDVFGSIIGYNGIEETDYLFTNQELDLESELYYYNARYYNPNLGRFISRDSYLGRIGDSLSRNGYIYVKNNPLKYIDPSGEEEQSLMDMANQGICGVNMSCNTIKKQNSNYFSDSLDQLIYGNYTNKVTALGTAGQIGTGLLGVDLPGDIRDIWQDLSNWEWSWGHAGKTTIDAIGLLPVIGAIKYVDEGAALVKGTSKVEKSVSKAPDFIVTPKGDVFPIPKGAVGPVPVDSGKGFKYIDGSGGNGLDKATTDFRFMDPVTSGKYDYPNGYGSYSNTTKQTVNPFTGKPIPKSDPWWHISW